MPKDYHPDIVQQARVLVSFTPTAFQKAFRKIHHGPTISQNTKQRKQTPKKEAMPCFRANQKTQTLATQSANKFSAKGRRPVYPQNRELPSNTKHASKQQKMLNKSSPPIRKSTDLQGNPEESHNLSQFSTSASQVNLLGKFIPTASDYNPEPGKKGESSSILSGDTCYSASCGSELHSFSSQESLSSHLGNQGQFLSSARSQDLMTFSNLDTEANVPMHPQTTHPNEFDPFACSTKYSKSDLWNSPFPNPNVNQQNVQQTSKSVSQKLQPVPVYENVSSSAYTFPPKGPKVYRKSLKPTYSQDVLHGVYETPVSSATNTQSQTASDIVEEFATLSNDALHLTNTTAHQSHKADADSSISRITQKASDNAKSQSLLKQSTSINTKDHAQRSSPPTNTQQGDEESLVESCKILGDNLQSHMSQNQKRK